MKALSIALLFALPSLAQAGGYVGFGAFPSVSATSDDQGLGLMLGVQFDFKHVSIRARYETYNTESNLDLSDFGLGLSVRF